MKNPFQSIRSEKGFLMLHVVWVVLILLLSIHFLVMNYQQGRQISINQMLYIEMETLFQMGYKAARKELESHSAASSYPTVYSFPQGEAEVTLKAETDKKILMRIEVKPMNNSRTYTINRTYYIP